jgi:hypothetical protein
LHTPSIPALRANSTIRCATKEETPRADRDGDPRLRQAAQLAHFRPPLVPSATSVLSEASLQSEWVMTELRKARTAERQSGQRKLFPPWKRCATGSASMPTAARTARQPASHPIPLRRLGRRAARILHPRFLQL